MIRKVLFVTVLLAAAVSFQALDTGVMAQETKLSAKDQEQVQNFYQEGLKFYLKRDFQKASESWQKALVIDSENEKVKEYLDKSQEKFYQAMDLFYKGMDAFKKKDYTGAEQNLKESLLINPLDERTKYYLRLCAVPEIQTEVKKNYFSPSVQDNKFFVKVDLSKTVPAWIGKWQLSVVDPQNKAVRSISGAGNPPSEIAWDVKDNNGQVYKGSKAKYALLLTAIYNDRVVSSLTNAVTTDGDGPAIKVTAPDSFSPNDTTGKRLTKAMFNLDIQDQVSGVADTKIDIYKSDKTTLLASLPVTGKKQFEWDGTLNQEGSKVPQGEDIYYQVVSDDNAQNESRSELIKMVVELGYSVKGTDVMVNLPNIEFEKGAATLLPSSYAVLNVVGGMLKKLENASFNIRGHTSTEGTVEINKALSQQRAAAVATYLRTKYRIPAERITSEGLGSSEAAPENSEEDKKRNRRVEIIMKGVSLQEVLSGSGK